MKTNFFTYFLTAISLTFVYSNTQAELSFDQHKELAFVYQVESTDEESTDESADEDSENTEFWRGCGSNKCIMSGKKSKEQVKKAIGGAKIYIGKFGKCSVYTGKTLKPSQTSVQEVLGSMREYCLEE